jgi:hypothetical protein
LFHTSESALGNQEQEVRAVLAQPADWLGGMIDFALPRLQGALARRFRGW